MARRYGTNQAGSSKCRVCNNRVSINHRDYPYCYRHGSMKTSVSQVSERYKTASTSAEKKAIREHLYKPTYTSVSPVRSSVTLVGDYTPGMPSVAVKRSCAAWLRSTKGIDMSYPQRSYEAMDEAMDSVRSSLRKDCDVMELNFSDGSTRLGDGSIILMDDHRGLLATCDGGNFVIDVATTAPLRSYTDGSIYDLESPAGDQFGDCFSVKSLAEFGFYSDARWRKIEDSQGEVFWDNSDFGESDIDKQREIIKNSPKLIQVKPTYLQDASDYESGYFSDDELIEEVSKSEGRDEELSEEQLFKKLRQAQARRKRSKRQ